MDVDVLITIITSVFGVEVLRQIVSGVSAKRAAQGKAKTELDLALASRRVWMTDSLTVRLIAIRGGLELPPEPPDPYLPKN